MDISKNESFSSEKILIFLKNWSKNQIKNLQDPSYHESFNSEKILTFLEKSELKPKIWQFLLKIGAKYYKNGANPEHKWGVAPNSEFTPKNRSIFGTLNSEKVS